MPRFTTQSLNFVLIFTISMFWSCAEKQSKLKTLVFEPGYQQIQDIFSIASCSSPFGTYSTEVHSLANGGCYFMQKFSDNDPPFIVKLDSINKGYVVTENDSILSTLSAEDVEMIRGHEIHKMGIDPNYFYSNINYEKNVNHSGQDYELFIGKDKLDHPVKLLYDRSEKLISKIELLNPKDTSETIEIVYDVWTDSRFGKMAKEIYFIQAKKDTFFFNFQSLKVSDETGHTTII